MNTQSFEVMLTGGHPNSLGNTVEVVDTVLAHSEKLEELYACYFSSDETVRLRTSNALKRVSKERPEWLIPYIDGLLRDVSQIEAQASTETLDAPANSFRELELSETNLGTLHG